MASSTSSTTTATRTTTKKKKEKELGKLYFDNNNEDGGAFFGRKFELDQLESSYERLLSSSLTKSSSNCNNENENGNNNSNESSEVVLISGFAGVGKSHLVQKFIQSKKQQKLSASHHDHDQGFILHGKSDEFLSATEPCSPLVDAITRWVKEIKQQQQQQQQQILRRKDDDETNNNNEIEIDDLKDCIQNAVGEEGKVLTDLIPALIDLIGEQPQLQKSFDSACATNRLKYVFMSFIKALISMSTKSKSKKPLILILDDIHWADPTTLDLLSLVVTNSSVKNFMLVATYRDNEVLNQGQGQKDSEDDDDDHILIKTLDKIRSQGKAYLTINLGNLTFKDCSYVVKSAMQLLKLNNNNDTDDDDDNDDDTHQDLVSALVERTHGNPFYLQTALQLLEKKQILKYSFVTMKWEYNIEQVQTELSVTDNVVVLILENLQTLHTKLQSVLAVASFLTSSFHIDILLGVLLHQKKGRQRNIVVEVVEKSEEEEEEESLLLIELLEEAVREGILENMIGSPVYKFAHDRIKQAAKMLVPTEDQHSICQQAGMYLLEENNKDDDSSSAEHLFVAVDLLNTVPLHLLSVETIQLIEWNVDAADVACRMSAFAVALNNLHKGVELMDTLLETINPWNDHYRLCLRLYTMACSVELAVGDFMIGKDYYDTIQEHGRSFDEKYPSIKAYSDGLGQRERHAEALVVDKGLLLEVGQKPFNTNLVNFFYRLTKLKRKLNNVTDEDILKLPVSQDKNHIIAVETLSTMCVRAFLCDQLILSVLCTVRGVDLTLKHGLTKASSYIFAGYGNLGHMALGEPDLGNRMVALSTQIAKITEAKAFVGKILFCINNYTKCWFDPLPKLLDGYKRGYNAAIASGDIEFACFSLIGYSIYHMYSGLSLNIALEDCEECDGLVKHYEVESVAAVQMPFMEFLLALTGKKKDVLQYFTKDLDFLKKKKLASDKSKTFRLLHGTCYGMQLAYYFGEIDTANQFREEHDKFKGLDTNFSIVAPGFLFTSLIATAMYRKTGDRKHLKIAKKAINGIKKMLEKKPMNLLHTYQIMEADHCSTVPGKLDDGAIRKKFNDAISAAQRSGFMQDAAIVNELAGEWQVRVGDEFWAKIYLTKARDLYDDWGATGKVVELMNRHSARIDAATNTQGKMRTSRVSQAGLAAKTMTEMASVDFSEENKSSGSKLLDSTQISLGSDTFDLQSCDKSSKSPSLRFDEQSGVMSQASTLTSATALKEDSLQIKIKKAISS